MVNSFWKSRFILGLTIVMLSFTVGLKTAEASRERILEGHKLDLLRNLPLGCAVGNAFWLSGNTIYRIGVVTAELGYGIFGKGFFLSDGIYSVGEMFAISDNLAPCENGRRTAPAATEIGEKPEKNSGRSGDPLSHNEFYFLTGPNIN